MTSVVSILRNKYALILTLALLAEGILYYSAFGSEKVPPNRPLEMFNTDFSGWQMINEGHVEKETMEILRADDTLTRSYAKAAYPVAAGFFVAYFRTQRTGQSVHSPKNCLPGSGWEPFQEGYITVPVSVEPRSIQINRYLVSRGENASVVLYWYQTRTRVIASDYSAKIWLVLDSIRYHRSDTALVRVIVPVLNGNDAQATQEGVDFVQSMFPLLQAYLPG
jgi:EpsI family protein